METSELTLGQRRILNEVQRDIPLDPTPFSTIARQLDANESEILAELGKMRETKLIRTLGPLFDGRLLGYQSCLAALACDPGKLEASAEVVGGHPGVSHNYERNHYFNLWFTLAIPPDSILGVEGTVDALRSRSGALRGLVLRSEKSYKLKVHFDMVGGDDSREDYTPLETHFEPLDDVTIRVVRELQKPFPLVSRPFDDYAVHLGVEVVELLTLLKKMKGKGILKRISAQLHHRKAGFTANGMGVWVAPPERIDAIGERMASYKSVSHCYRRNTAPGWSYNLFSMIHGKSTEEVEATAREISRETGLDDYQILYSPREFKKRRISYFTPDLYEWEATIWRGH